MKRFDQAKSGSDKRKKQPAPDPEGSSDEDEVDSYPPSTNGSTSRLSRPRKLLPSRITVEYSRDLGNIKVTEEFDNYSPPPKRPSQLRHRKVRARHEDDFESQSDQSGSRNPSSRTAREDPADSAYGTGESTDHKAAYLAGSSSPVKGKQRSHRQDHLPHPSVEDSNEEGVVEEVAEKEVEPDAGTTARNRHSQRTKQTSAKSDDDEHITPPVNTDDIEDESDNDIAEFPIWVKNGKGQADEITSLLDTGTDRNWISDEFRKTLDLSRVGLTEDEKEKRWLNFNGVEFGALGKVELEIMSNKFTGYCRRKVFYIAKGGHFSILIGRNTISKEKLLCKPEATVQGDDAYVALQSKVSKSEKVQISKDEAEQEEVAAALAAKRQAARASKLKPELVALEGKSRSQPTASAPRPGHNFAARVPTTEKPIPTVASSSKSCATTGKAILPSKSVSKKSIMTEKVIVPATTPKKPSKLPQSEKISRLPVPRDRKKC